MLYLRSINRFILFGLLTMGCFQTTSASMAAVDGWHWEDPVEGGNWLGIANNLNTGSKIESVRWDFVPHVLADFSVDRGSQPAMTYDTGDGTGWTFGPQDMAFGQDYFTISFSDFDPGEYFEFSLDLDYLTQDDWQVGAERFVDTLLTVAFMTPQGSQQLQGSFIDARTNDNMYLMNSVSMSPVPVPAAAWLFGTALIGLIGFCKRRTAT